MKQKTYLCLNILTYKTDIYFGEYDTCSDKERYGYRYEK